MKKFIIPIIFLFVLGNILAQESKISGELEKKWEAENLDTPESVLMDASGKVLYVSNIGGKNPTEKDGNGFITTIDVKGSIIELKWIEGLNAPKGMAISGDFLYVTDIDRLVKINIKERKIDSYLPIDGALFLNDIVALKNGDLLISDSKSNNYILVKDKKYEIILTDGEMKFPNGITLAGEDVYTGVGNKIIKVDRSSWTINDYILNTGGVDGISRVKEGLFLISDWQGRVHLISPDSKKLILDTTEQEVNAADFHFDTNTKMLFIPTFFSNSVVCYELN